MNYPSPDKISEKDFLPKEVKYRYVPENNMPLDGPRTITLAITNISHTAEACNLFFGGREGNSPNISIEVMGDGSKQTYADLIKEICSKECMYFDKIAVDYPNIGMHMKWHCSSEDMKLLGTINCTHSIFLYSDPHAFVRVMTKRDLPKDFYGHVPCLNEMSGIRVSMPPESKVFIKLEQYVPAENPRITGNIPDSLNFSNSTGSAHMGLTTLPFSPNPNP